MICTSLVYTRMTPRELPCSFTPCPALIIGHYLPANLASQKPPTGHSNGTVTMWSPSMKEPLVKMLCHHGPVTALAIDNAGRLEKYAVWYFMEL